jgi:hypothetical protein
MSFAKIPTVGTLAARFSNRWKFRNRKITLEKGRNAYFNDEMDARGEI